MLLTHDLALSANQFLCKKKSLRVCALGEIELAKLILVGTRITYQATGDAGCTCKLIEKRTRYHTRLDHEVTRKNDSKTFQILSSVIDSIYIIVPLPFPLSEMCRCYLLAFVRTAAAALLLQENSNVRTPTCSYHTTYGITIGRPDGLFNTVFILPLIVFLCGV